MSEISSEILKPYSVPSLSNSSSITRLNKMGLSGSPCLTLLMMGIFVVSEPPTLMTVQMLRYMSSTIAIAWGWTLWRRRARLIDEWFTVSNALARTKRPTHRPCFLARFREKTLKNQFSGQNKHFCEKNSDANLNYFWIFTFISFIFYLSIFSFWVTGVSERYDS